MFKTKLEPRSLIRLHFQHPADSAAPPGGIVSTDRLSPVLAVRTVTFIALETAAVAGQFYLPIIEQRSIISKNEI